MEYPLREGMSGVRQNEDPEVGVWNWASSRSRSSQNRDVCMRLYLPDQPTVLNPSMGGWSRRKGFACK